MKKRNKSKKSVVIIPSIMIIFICLTIVWEMQDGGAQTADAPIAEAVFSERGDLLISAAEITDTAVFYPVEVDGVEMEVLAVRAADGSIRTAFNTCQVCYGSGRGYYIQDGSDLVCQNCGNRFSTEQIEIIRGGCNPVPITTDEKQVQGDEIVIGADTLSYYKEIFTNWKSQN